MNRTISFNAWDLKTGIMLEDVVIGHGTVGLPNDEEINAILKSKGFDPDEDNLPNHWFDTGEDWYHVEGCIPLQFTGVEDVNGKEIHEGHIILLRDSNNFKAVIEYYKNGFYLNDVTRSNWSGEDVEVIGNIFENPELIK